MRWRVSRATGTISFYGSGGQLLHQVHVLLLRFFLRGAFQLGPGFILGCAHKIEEPGLVTTDITFRALFLQRVKSQQGVIVGSFCEALDGLGCLLEAAFQICHVMIPPSDQCHLIMRR